MKVYVFSKEDIEGYVPPEDREGVGWIKDCVSTEVDIPGGCQLAVVENGKKPDFGELEGEAILGPLHYTGLVQGQELLWESGYRRVIQTVEVK